MDTNTHSQPTDAFLVNEYISGSELALEQLINRHKLRILISLNLKF